MKQFAFYSGVIMIAIYVVMGLTLIFTNAFINELGNNKTFIGVGLIIYAAFRLWMTLRLFRNQKNTSANNE
jgi:hypothetical protein